ncbi:MAG: hypothetical protein H5U08_08620 [Thermogutta sp.]|uniref:hypothetical protein n=1 Tax=Thermogutta sp. TaxID=1962930 RepID=UPI0019B370E9|nr:hypothetical protein [Thermogutta sp.]MBC7352407.1 hypothetical protein [Thermogutta sp.]
MHHLNYCEYLTLLGILLGTQVSCFFCEAEEIVGKRPYEMDWAGRTEDTRPPLIDFENLDGWTVETRNAVASFIRSREQQIWGKYVGKLTYRGVGPNPAIIVRPPQPVPFAGPVDCVNVWIYGNNWAWVPDPTTPQVQITILLKSPDGRSIRVDMGRVYWREWFLVHTRLRPEDAKALERGGVVEGIEISGGTNAEDRVLYFDNLTPYLEPLPPLVFAPRPRRPLTLPEGQTTGTNTGPGVLPFPTREKTILPDQLTQPYRTELVQTGDAFEFRYEGADSRFTYRYQPREGHWGDVAVVWSNGLTFRPMVSGGIRLRLSDGRVVEPRYTLLDCRRKDQLVVSRWRAETDGLSTEVTYTFRLWQKSLVIDVACRGGTVGEVQFGYAEGVPSPRLVTLPYLTCDARRPAVVVAGDAGQPLFMMGLVDYYRSNASALFAINDPSPHHLVYNGGARYLPRTDGKLNDCFERFFLTVSPQFEEVLPNIPNPKSPWMHVAGERVWRAHGASNREHDYALWKRVARYGMTKIVVTDHETGWRDGGESFTLRTRAAPGKGGDEGQRWYAQKMQELGFRYGIYNNYTDYAPVNEFWDEDCVTRLSDGSWRRAWPRCYNLKPARAVEFEAKLAPIIQEKFHLSTAYCDVHTAVRPWDYCDFDARVPGAGTFAATFYAYGEIMLHQKATWNGPVYSEGNNHWYYCGLTDGNYGQDQLARLDINPWLVDFDLRKLHPLCCNFGMGNLGMFYPQGHPHLSDEEALDRFLAATLAFGHTGFLVMEGGMGNAVRSYYSVQQIHARYAQATVTDIRYCNEEGRLEPTSRALLTGAYRRSQVYVKYSNGLELWVNGHSRDLWHIPEMDLTLPPNGWCARGEFPDGHLLAYSALINGHRCDYVESPAYIYANGRGRITRFPRALCDGQLVLLPKSDGSFELIPLDCTVMAVKLNGQSAKATGLDEEGREGQPVEVRFARGFVHVVPQNLSFSYRLVPEPPPSTSPNCDREAVVPGETVKIEGQPPGSWIVPLDAKPGSLVWHSHNGQWLDFRIVPVADVDLQVNATEQKWLLSLRSNLPEEKLFLVKLGEATQQVKLAPESWTMVSVPFHPPEKEGVMPVPVELSADGFTLRQMWQLRVNRQLVEIAPFPEIEFTVQCVRGGNEGPVDSATGAIVDKIKTSCGGVEKLSLFMHPPYRGGVGYVAAILKPVHLPPKVPACLRCAVGKGDGSDPGDGILYQVYVVDDGGQQKLLGEITQREHSWHPWELDLSPWAGQTIRLKLVADVGPAGNSVGDWGCWADLRIESREPQWVYTVSKEPQSSVDTSRR